MQIKVTKDLIDKVVDLSARDVPPKEIAEQLNAAREAVYAIRSKWGGSILARKNELQGRNIDGTPASVAHKPDDNIPDRPDLTPEAAFDQIMQTIAAVAEPEAAPSREAIPEPQEPMINPQLAIMESWSRPKPAEPAAIHTHMMPRTPEPDKPRVTVRSVELKGAFADYCLMHDHVEFLDGGMDAVTFDRLPALVADLQEILAMTESVVVWNPCAAKEARTA